LAFPFFFKKTFSVDFGIKKVLAGLSVVGLNLVLKISKLAIFDFEKKFPN
jgi:hypothetical protein